MDFYFSGVVVITVAAAEDGVDGVNGNMQRISNRQQRKNHLGRVYAITEGLRSDRTKAEYQRAFTAFLRWTNSEVHKILEKDPRDKSRHLSHSSINLYKSAIIHFFIINRITLNKDWISKFIKSSEGHREDDRGYSDEEIHRLLQASDERFRVVFLLLAATDMRIGAIPDLKIGHLSKSTLIVPGLLNIPRHWLGRLMDTNLLAKDKGFCSVLSVGECSIL